MAQQARQQSKSCKHKRSRSKTAAVSRNPLQFLLIILALAIAAYIFNTLSAAYVQRLKTQNILLAADLPQAAPQAAPDRALPEPPRPGSAAQNRFMALPGRLAAGALTGGMAAGDIAALEIAGGRSILDANRVLTRAPAESGRENLGKNRPDPANLAPQPDDTPQAIPVFAYKIDRPLLASSAVIMLLHGSGADEASLIPFARSVWPRATLIGLRGRIMQGTERRWYHKLSPTKFDQREALHEADALAQFTAALAAKNNYAPKNMIFLGYSNGANLLTVMAMKYPQLVNRAVLLRPMPVLAAMPQNNLHQQRILALSGAQDRLYGGYAEQLYTDLRQNGAQIISYRIPATHMPNREDEKIITRWLKLGY